MSAHSKDLVPGLSHHSLLLVTAHGIRAYTDHRTGELVSFGIDEAHPDHIKFLKDLFDKKSPKIEDYAGPVMSPEDIKDLLGLDTDTLFEREQEVRS